MAAPFRIYNTLTRKVEDFEPLEPGRVGLYVCGMTVYDHAHIGHARAMVVFDTFVRYLRHRGWSVRFVRNFTDVDDKINAAAASEGVDISVITDRYAKVYREDSAALNILRPSLEPAATAHMDEMGALIKTLVDDGFAYAAEGHVLFDVTAYEDYGKLSGRSQDDLMAGARVEVAPYKKNPSDFVLWKPSEPGDPVWDSPFGPGRPGWHLECSAMIKKQLGETIDIHGGGADLVFPHHENEIAQSTCAHGGKTLANYWMHNGFLSIDAEKMSKSLGNFVKPNELLEAGIKGETIRYAMLTGHYRAPLDWNDTLIERSQKSLDRLYGVLRRLKAVDATHAQPTEAVMKALNDDLNTPKALAALFEIAGRANKADTRDAQAQAKGELLAAGRLLGLFETDPDAWFGLESLSEDEKAEIDDLLAQRAEARKAKDFARADAIRDELTAKGVQAEDGPEGTTWRMKG